MAASHHIPSERDLELLSAYLDGELSNREREALERRLAQDANLNRTLNELRETVALLHGLPRLKAPRSFALDPAQYSRPLPWWQRIFTLGTALQLAGAMGTVASILLILAVLVLGGGEDDEKLAPVNESIALQPSTLPEDAVTATALQVQVELTAIAYSGEDLIQTTIIAQSTFYAGTPMAPGNAAVPPPSPTPPPAAYDTGAGAADSALDETSMADDAANEPEIAPVEEAPAPALGAAPPGEQAFSAESDTESPESDVGAAGMAQAAEAEEGAAGPVEPNSFEAEQAAREDDEDQDASGADTAQIEADGELRGPTETPLPEVAQAPTAEPPTGAPPAALREVALEDDEDTPWWLAGLGAVLLVISVSVFAFGRWKARA